LTVGALLSGMYLFLHNRLKSKRWSTYVRRYPSLEKMERYTDRAVVIGVPLLTMSLAVAVTTLIVEGSSSLLLDWKVLSSLAALTMFIIYIYQRAADKRPGQQLAKLYIASFGIL